MKEQLFSFSICLAYICLDILLFCITVCILVICFRFAFRVFHNVYNCILATKVTVRSNTDTCFHNNFDRKFTGKTIYLKYEITAKLNGFLSRLLSTEIPFAFEIPCSPDMKISLHEYSGIYSVNLNSGWVVSDKTKFIISAVGRKTETVKIVLKCDREPSSNDTLFYFKINFDNKYINKLYSRAFALQFMDYKE